MQHDTTSANPDAYAQAVKLATEAALAAGALRAQAFRLTFDTIETTEARRDAIAAHKAADALCEAAEAAAEAVRTARANAMRREAAAARLSA